LHYAALNGSTARLPLSLFMDIGHAHHKSSVNPIRPASAPDTARHKWFLLGREFTRGTHPLKKQIPRDFYQQGLRDNDLLWRWLLRYKCARNESLYPCELCQPKDNIELHPKFCIHLDVVVITEKIIGMSKRSKHGELKKSHNASAIISVQIGL
jgi:hypothetical protein